MLSVHVFTNKLLFHYFIDIFVGLKYTMTLLIIGYLPQDFLYFFVSQNF